MILKLKKGKAVLFTLIAVIMAALCGALLSACGGKSSGGTEPTVESSSTRKVCSADDFENWTSSTNGGNLESKSDYNSLKSLPEVEYLTVDNYYYFVFMIYEPDFSASEINAYIDVKTRTVSGEYVYEYDGNQSVGVNGFVCDSNTLYGYYRYKPLTNYEMDDLRLKDSSDRRNGLMTYFAYKITPMIAGTLFIESNMWAPIGDSYYYEHSAENIKAVNVIDGTNESKTAVKVDDFNIKTVDMDGYDGNTVSGDDRPLVEYGYTYYIVADFSITALSANDGTQNVYCCINIVNSSWLEATVEDVASSEIKTIPTESGVLIRIRYKAPENKDAKKTLRIIVGLSPFASGTSDVECFITSDEVNLQGTVYKNCNIAESKFISHLGFELDSKTDTFTVYGNAGELMGKDEVEIPSEYNGRAVTKIKGGGFADTELKKIIIPASITSIGGGAFDGCSKLYEISVDEGNANYKSKDGILYDSALKNMIHVPAALGGSVTIPSTISSIGTQFAGTKITGITLHDTLRITGSAFSGCTKLRSVTLPATVTDVVYKMFYNCSSLGTVTFKGTIKTVGSEAFSGCTSLTGTLSFPAATSVASNAFYECSSLSGVELASSITRIEKDTFYGCSSMKSIALPESLEYIGDYAFMGSGLTSLTFPASIKTVSEYAFAKTALKSVTIPKCSTYPSMFEGCKSLTSVTFEEGVQSISNSMFKGCIALTTINLPSTLTSIGHNAFEGCTSIKSFTVPATVTWLGWGIFKGCTSLTSVTFATATGWTESSTNKGVNVSNAKTAATLMINNTDKIWVRK